MIYRLAPGEGRRKKEEEKGEGVKSEEVRSK